MYWIALNTLNNKSNDEKLLKITEVNIDRVINMLYVGEIFVYLILMSAEMCLIAMCGRIWIVEAVYSIH